MSSVNTPLVPAITTRPEVNPSAVIVCALKSNAPISISLLAPWIIAKFCAAEVVSVPTEISTSPDTVKLPVMFNSVPLNVRLASPSNSVVVAPIVVNLSAAWLFNAVIVPVAAKEPPDVIWISFPASVVKYNSFCAAVLTQSCPYPAVSSKAFAFSATFKLLAVISATVKSPAVIVKFPVLAPVAVVVPKMKASLLSSHPIKALSSASPLSITIPLSLAFSTTPLLSSKKLSLITVFVDETVVNEPLIVTLPDESISNADISSKPTAPGFILNLLLSDLSIPNVNLVVLFCFNISNTSPSISGLLIVSDLLVNPPSPLTVKASVNEASASDPELFKNTDKLLSSTCPAALIFGVKLILPTWFPLSSVWSFWTVNNNLCWLAFPGW